MKIVYFPQSARQEILIFESWGIAVQVVLGDIERDKSHRCVNYFFQFNRLQRAVTPN